MYVDDDLKAKSDSLFRDLGTDTTTAIGIVLTQAVAANGFPFEIKRSIAYNPYMPLTENQIFDKLENARRDEAQGKYRTSEDMIADLRAKYGLFKSFC